MKKKLKNKFPEGFSIGSAATGLKGRRADVGLIYCAAGFRASALFTKNRFKAAPILVSKSHLPDGKLVLANSGCANAATGGKGVEDALKLCAFTGKLFGSGPEEVLQASTGVIGTRLPVEKIKKAVKKIRKKFSLSPAEPDAFAHSIMTTDTRRKTASAGSVWACAKGSGMINPDMATFLCFILTDAKLPRGKEKAILAECAAPFNRISVDGEMSTNDSVFLLSSGLKKVPAARLKKNILAVCSELAEKIIDDGEGRKKVIRIKVLGADTGEAAKKTAQSLASSMLIKTAFNGGSPNWGRIISRVGSLGVALDDKKIEVSVCGIKVFSGLPLKFRKAVMLKRLKKKNVFFEVNLHAGRGKCEYLTTDLSCDYVKINAGYLS